MITLMSLMSYERIPFESGRLEFIPVYIRCFALRGKLKILASKSDWKIFELTEPETVFGELPFVAVIGQTITLLIKGDLVGIHDDGQVPRL